MTHMPCLMQQSFDFNDPTAALRADCSKAVEILTRMTRDTATKGNDILPLDYLKRCKVGPCCLEVGLLAHTQVRLSYKASVCTAVKMGLPGLLVLCQSSEPYHMHRAAFSVCISWVMHNGHQVGPAPY